MNKTKQLVIRVQEQDMDSLRELAEDERRSVSDMVRLAVEEFAARRGKTIRLEVDRGGYRGRKEE